MKKKTKIIGYELFIETDLNEGDVRYELDNFLRQVTMPDSRTVIAAYPDSLAKKTWEKYWNKSKIK